MTILELAQARVGAGVSVLPIKTDGSKAPKVAKWEQWQDSLPTSDELNRLFRGSCGIGTICGKVSGNLEIIDIDEKTLFEPFTQQVDEACPGLMARLTTIDTPRGYHLAYRCEEIQGNQKLAKRSKDDPLFKANKQTLIETRGEGGYVLAPGSPAECHEERRLYQHISGPPIEKSPMISVDERALLWQVARSFNRFVDDAKVVAGKPSGQNGTLNGISPGDDFNQRTTWHEILEPHGWTATCTRGDVTHWRRPGKSLGTSATTGLISGSGNVLLCVFSSNAHPFESGNNCGTYTKFAAHALLNHSGDFAEAARQLGKDGYGSKAKKPGTKTAPADSVKARPEVVDQNDRKPGKRAQVVRLDQIEPEEIEWLWEGRIAIGKLTAIAGQPGSGKSLVTVDLGARISKGDAWPNDEGKAEMGDVIYLAAEDTAPDIILPRLIEAGGERSRVHVIQAIKQTDDETGKEFDRPFSIAADLAVLEEVLIERPNTKMLVIDPIGSYLGQGTDSHKDSEVRAVLTPLVALADKYRLAVIIVCHLSKSQSASAQDRIMGSVAFSALARAAWMITKDEQDPNRRWMSCVKNNLGNDQIALSYQLAFTAPKKPPHLEWYAEGVQATADDFVAKGAAGGDRKRDKAAQWLADYLADGAKQATDGYDAGRQAGYSKTTLKRAREELRVDVWKDGQGPWMWELPDDHVVPLASFTSSTSSGKYGGPAGPLQSKGSNFRAGVVGRFTIGEEDQPPKEDQLLTTTTRKEVEGDQEGQVGVHRSVWDAGVDPEVVGL